MFKHRLNKISKFSLVMIIRFISWILENVAKKRGISWAESAGTFPKYIFVIPFMDPALFWLFTVFILHTPVIWFHWDPFPRTLELLGTRRIRENTMTPCRGFFLRPQGSSASAFRGRTVAENERQHLSIWSFIFEWCFDDNLFFT